MRVSRRRLLGIVTGATALLSMRFATAHHSTAEFDYTKQITIKGTVKEVQWSVEIGSPSLNINLGWRKNSVKAGDEITMLLSPARNGTPYGTLRVLTFADGRQLEGVAARVRALPPPPASQ
jgi:hypothetical protein